MRFTLPALFVALASPAIAAEKDTRVYEMRVYTAEPGKLDALHARFKDHTLKLFEKHGITNLWYFTLMKDQKSADEKLIYFLAHRNIDAAKTSFDAFRKDPDWTKVRTASEEKAGGPLTVKEGGVKSEFLKPTDYSPTK